MSNEEALTAPQTPVPDPKSILINNILIILGFIGIFIAGYLSLAKLQNMVVPCGLDSQGCARVDNSEMSRIGGIYVGYLGLAGYLILTGLAVARGFLNGRDWTLFVRVGFIMSALGAAFSFYLTFSALAMLQTTCSWCLSSAGVMAVICALHYVLVSRPAPQANPPKPMLAVGVGLVACLGLFGFFYQKLKAEIDTQIITIDASNPGLPNILPRAAKIEGGGPDAPVMVIEFADYNCPACRGSFAATHAAIKAAGPKMGFAFRQFPLFNQEGHESSLEASLIGEYAADEGKYFEWVSAAFDPVNNSNVKSMDGLARIAEQIGLDASDVKAIIEGTHPKSEAYLDAVNDDMATARTLGALSTPTIIVMAKDHQPVIVPYTKVADLLAREPYKSLLQ